MTATLHLNAEELAEVRKILGWHLPPGTNVKVFGSRAGGSPKQWSDLDLLIEADAPLSLGQLGALAEAFDESALPWKVDVVDRKALDPAFAAQIDQQAVKL